MLKSLYSGVTGMRSQQTKMDVISNNIANVSTTGFKAGRVRFQDLISQVESPAQGPGNNLGGVNPRQVGMGVQVSGTDTIMTGGSLQTTSRSLDFGIENGDNSFFIVSDTGDTESNKQYTRDGAFFADANGDLLTGSGMRVMGYTNKDGSIQVAEKPPVFPLDTPPTNPTLSTPPTANEIALKKEYDEYKAYEKYDADVKNLTTGDLGKLTIIDKQTVPDPGDVTKTIEIELESFQIDDSGTIVGTYENGDIFILGRVALASFKNPDGLEKAGGNLYNRTLNSGDPVAGAPSEAGFAKIRSGFLEMSNVDLANEFTEMIVTSRAYQANSRSITTSDEMIQELLSLKR